MEIAIEAFLELFVYFGNTELKTDVISFIFVKVILVILLHFSMDVALLIGINHILKFLNVSLSILYLPLNLAIHLPLIKAE